jgi:hypothetical protein
VQVLPSVVLGIVRLRSGTRGGSDVSEGESRLAVRILTDETVRTTK